MNANQNDFSANSSYSVTSSFISSISLGALTMGAAEMNAALVEFNNGTEYIYLGVSDEAMDAVEEVCVRNAENADASVGHVFLDVLRPCQCYARLNQNI